MHQLHATIHDQKRQLWIHQNQSIYQNHLNDWNGQKIVCVLFVVCCLESAHNTLQMPSLYADGLQEMANNALARKLIRHMNKKLNVLLKRHKEPEIKKKPFHSERSKQATIVLQWV